MKVGTGITPPSNAAHRMAKARTNLILDYPWFGSLALKLLVESTEANPEMYKRLGVETMATNGTTLVYHPPFVDTLTEHEVLAVIAHEVLHCALLHPFRRGQREAQRWNIACDYAINQICADSGLKLPAMTIQPNPAYKDMTADQIYAMLPESTEKEKRGSKLGGVLDNPGKGTGKGQGESKDDPKGKGEGDRKGKGKGEATEGEGQGEGDGEEMTETDWQIAAKQAEMVASKAGKMPLGVSRGLSKANESKADWRALLHRFVSATMPYDYSWSRPNRRFIGEGLYLPGIRKENMGEFVVAIDTSGSVTPKMLEQFAGEIQEIMSSCAPEKITVIYCDSRVNGVAEFTQNDSIELEMKGGGGTAFNPVFEAVAAMEVQPKALVYLTDLDSYDSPVEPSEYPVLWVTPEWVTKGWAWGEVVRIAVES